MAILEGQYFEVHGALYSYYSVIWWMRMWCDSCLFPPSVLLPYSSILNENISISLIFIRIRCFRTIFSINWMLIQMERKKNVKNILLAQYLSDTSMNMVRKKMSPLCTCSVPFKWSWCTRYLMYKCNSK